MQILESALDLVSQAPQCVFDKWAQEIVCSPMALSCPFILRAGEASQALPRAARWAGPRVTAPVPWTKVRRGD